MIVVNRLPSFKYYVHAIDLDPIEIGLLFGIPSTYQYRRGDRKLIYNPERGLIGSESSTWWYGAWCLDSGMELTSNNMYDHVNFMVTFLTRHESAVKYIVGEDAYDSHIIMSNWEGHSFFLSAEELALLADGCNEFTLYI